MWRVLIRELLFAEDAALTAHTEEDLQWLICCFTCACRVFGLTISLKKTNIMDQDLSSISISEYILEVVEDFTYLGSTIYSNLSLDAKLNTLIGKVVTAMASLAKSVWENSMLTINTKMRCTKPACSAHCFMAVKHGLCTPAKNADSMPSTCSALEGFWASPGKTLSQTGTSWLRQEYQACLPCLPKGTCLAWSCQPHAGWPSPQGHGVWKACHWLQTCRKACSLLQRCL